MKQQIKSIKKYLSILIIITFFIWTIYYIYQHKQDFSILKEINIPLLTLITSLNLLFLYFNGLFFKYLLKPFNINLSFKEHFGLSNVSTLWNYITPFRGGAGIRAIYLKNTHNFNYSKFMISLGGNYIIVFWVNSFFALLGLLIYYLKTSNYNILITLIFFGMFGTLSLIILFHPKIPKTNYKILNKIKNILDSWNTLRTQKKTILLLSILAFSNIVIGTSIMFLEFKAINTNISIIQALLFTSITGLSLFISITPGALGIKESFIILTSQIFTIGVSEGLLVSLIDRSIILTIVFILGNIYSIILIKRNKTFTSPQNTSNHPKQNQ